MNTYIRSPFTNINATIYDLLSRLLSTGTTIHSRDGDTIELTYVDFSIENPRNRNLHMYGRTNNFFATIAETVWVLSGNNEIDPVLSFFLPRAKNYSDDGKIWTNGYGHKLYQGGQVDNIIKELSNNINSRRAVMSIWTPFDDTLNSLDKRGISNPKDISCTNWIGFLIRDNKLDMKVQMRSNDILFGMSHINIFEWTLFQEIIMNILKNEHRELTLGTFRYSVASLHMYERNRDQAESIVKKYINESDYSVDPIRLSPLICSESSMKDLFQSVYNTYADTIESHDDPYMSFSRAVSELNFLFMKYMIPPSVLYEYVIIPLIWILWVKSNQDTSGKFHKVVSYYISTFNEDIKKSIYYSNNNLFCELS